MDLFLLFLSFLLMWIGLYYFYRTEFSIPGPYGIPVLGYLPFVDPRAPHKTLLGLTKKYGPIYATYLGSVYTVILSDATLIREAFKKEEFNGRAPLYLTHGIMGGYGIICAEGPLWKDQRRQLIDWMKKLGMTKFGSSAKAILENTIDTGITEFLKAVRIHSVKSLEMNPAHALHHSMGNILNKLVFGITYDEDDVTWKYLQKLQEEGVKHIGISGVVNFLPWLRFLPSNRRTIKFLLDGKKRTHEIYDKIIEKWEEVINEKTDMENATNDNDDGSNNDEVQCILECFLKESKRRQRNNDPLVSFYCRDQLRHLLADMFGAGLDTSFTTIRWFLLYMAKNCEIQSELRSTLYANENGELCLSDLEQIDILKACISETQRIRSVVPLGIPHGSVQAGRIGKYEIPKNTMIVPFLWSVHMDPTVWNDPEKFNPYRFLDSDGKYFAPSQFMPFQTGKRMCIGDEMARMMLYKFAATILYHYELKLSPTSNGIDMNGECGITLTPSDYSLMFQPIDHQTKSK